MQWRLLEEHTLYWSFLICISTSHKSVIEQVINPIQSRATYIFFEFRGQNDMT